MSLSLIFRPDGYEPTRDDFRILRPADGSGSANTVTHFDTTEQLVKYLKDRTWPTGERPWVDDGSKVMTPDDITTLIGSQS